ncbi:putative quinol monooxygenase [Acinetobacter sp. ANC 3882]|uniref:putative quinol monooxygenase n=1 Tax=Acinetobacter sp. ANC 3882 TaxID=2923423 RepID=UPI001F4AE1E4|nr:putative quinol monooxygenase [Acinetobacter sp. ANC 3882]MCH7313561.1 antibiotic biosynthesis monooxygenase [Acinetobacter sp. ANC 3882]
MTLKLIAEDFIQPDCIDIVLPLYQELVEKTRTEAGCIAYDLYHDHKQIGHFVFIEEWVDRSALERHVQSEHFQCLVPQIDQYQTQAGRFTYLHGFETLLSKKEDQ